MTKKLFKKSIKNKRRKYLKGRKSQKKIIYKGGGKVKINEVKRLCKKMCSKNHKNYDCVFKKNMCTFYDDEYRMRDCNVESFYKEIKKLDLDDKIKIKKYEKAKYKGCADR